MSSDDDDDAQQQLAQRVQRGDFDAVLRPASPEEALCEGPERFFALAAEIARSQYEPVAHWDEFVYAFWQQVNAGFGLTADEDDDAVAAAWFDHPEDPPVVVWDRDRSGIKD